jgi:hypothetical protein
MENQRKGVNIMYWSLGGVLAMIISIIFTALGADNSIYGIIASSIYLFLLTLYYFIPFGAIIEWIRRR